MNDRAVSLFEQYDIEVNRTFKGRGAILCDSNKGLLILKEYNGPTPKVAFQDFLLNYIKGQGFVGAESILRTKEMELIVRDQDQVPYIVKTYFEGKECNQRDLAECKQAVETLACYHKVADIKEMKDILLQQPVYQIESEYEKHNKELKKVRNFLRQKSQKTEFELCLLKCYDYFLDRALLVTKEMQNELPSEDTYDFSVVCHGDYQYHNVIGSNGQNRLVNFEKCVRDYPIRDLYLFMRKLLEKNNWSQVLGNSLIEVYNKEKVLTKTDMEQLKIRFAYPEKFWKIVNFYYNSGKAWIPGKNIEKLEKLFAQEREKQLFIETVLN